MDDQFGTHSMFCDLRTDRVSLTGWRIRGVHRAEHRPSDLDPEGARPQQMDPAPRPRTLQ
jgi:hypothetical protein